MITITFSTNPPKTFTVKEWVKVGDDAKIEFINENGEKKEYNLRISYEKKGLVLNKQ